MIYKFTEKHVGVAIKILVKFDASKIIFNLK